VIEVPTVFVLGAGASAPYKFPTGRSLLLRIGTDLSSPRSDLYGQLNRMGFSPNHVGQFANDLLASMQPSVDLFLENRDEYREIGKAAIAASWIPIENEAFLRCEQQTLWYEYLYGMMRSDVSSFNRNRLQIVTLNYDRSLEHFLFLAIRHSFGLEESKAAAMLSAIPVIHVYGKLGELPYLSSEHQRPYSNILDSDLVRLAAECINIMNEGQADSQEFQQARHMIIDAERVYFLGFGYHHTNISRLIHLIPEWTKKGTRGRHTTSQVLRWHGFMDCSKEGLNSGTRVKIA